MIYNCSERKNSHIRTEIRSDLLSGDISEENLAMDESLTGRYVINEEGQFGCKVFSLDKIMTYLK